MPTPYMSFDELILIGDFPCGLNSSEDGGDRRCIYIYKNAMRFHPPYKLDISQSEHLLFITGINYLISTLSELKCLLYMIWMQDQLLRQHACILSQTKLFMQRRNSPPEYINSEFSRENVDQGTRDPYEAAVSSRERWTRRAKCTPDIQGCWTETTGHHRNCA